jgi:4-hydroxybenzoate polyprenyltransferase
MNGFFDAMFVEMAARRRRLRAALGDRGQALAEFLLLGGLALGSLGLFVRPWMAAATPWGFAVPFIFLAGYFLLEARRQRAASAAEDAEAVRRGYDWGVLLWSLACALVGAAAFVMAWAAEPAGEEAPWTPPENSVPVDIGP